MYECPFAPILGSFCDYKLYPLMSFTEWVKSLDKVIMFILFRFFFEKKYIEKSRIYRFTHFLCDSTEEPNIRRYIMSW